MLLFLFFSQTFYFQSWFHMQPPRCPPPPSLPPSPPPPSLRCIAALTLLSILPRAPSLCQNEEAAEEEEEEELTQDSAKRSRRSGILRRPGDRWMLRGPLEYVPPASVEVLLTQRAIPLDENEGIYVRDIKTGKVSGGGGA